MASSTSTVTPRTNGSSQCESPSSMGYARTVHSGRRNARGGIACERCRAHKLKCNREHPCARCQKVSVPCIYRDALRRVERQSLQPRPLAKKNSPPEHDNETEVSAPPRLTHRLRTGYQRAKARGFKGNTASLAVFQEARATLPPSGWHEIELAEEERQGILTEPDGDVKRLCASILSLIPCKDASYAAMEYFCTHDFCENKMETTARYYHDAFWSTFEQDLKTQAGRLSMSERLIANTRRHRIVPKTNAEWLNSISGHNSTWEMIGYLVLIYGNAAIGGVERDQVVEMLVRPDITSHQYATTMLEAADACLELSQSFDPAANLLSLQLFLRILRLQSVIYGDSSHDLWRRMGTIVNAATAIGLHRPLDSENVAPLYYQCWKSTAYSIFEFDKTLATFTGRPPAMSRRYMALKPPLDIPDSIVATLNSVTEFRDFVDEKGFSITGEITPATSIRVTSLEAFVRDEILEFALCKPSSDIGNTIAHLRTQAADTWSRMSPFFYRPINKQTLAKLKRFEVSNLTHTRLNYLQNLFLIERISEQHGDAEQLLKAAYEMVEIVIACWNERDRLPTLRDTCHWFISCYGIPAASALAIELLKNKGAAHSTRLPTQRGQITQILTLFIACLDWVVPTDGNYTLCGQVKTLIQRILNDVLASLFDGQAQAPTFDLSQFDVSSIPIFGADFDSWFDTDINLEWPEGFFQ